MLTQYVAVVGTETIFPPDRSVHLDAIADGTEHTLLVAELHRECVHWMAPHDVGPGAFALALMDWEEKGKNHPGGTQIALADGSSRFVPETIDRETLSALCTVNGGEKISDY